MFFHREITFISERRRPQGPNSDFLGRYCCHFPLGLAQVASPFPFHGANLRLVRAPVPILPLALSNTFTCEIIPATESNPRSCNSKLLQRNNLMFCLDLRATVGMVASDNIGLLMAVALVERTIKTNDLKCDGRTTKARR